MVQKIADIPDYAPNIGSTVIANRARFLQISNRITSFQIQT